MEEIVISPLIGMVITVVSTGFTVIGFIYAFLRNFKTDINSHIDRLEKRMDRFDARMDSMDERMFLMMTGKTLKDAILEERLKKESV
jgi:hypothetical protein